MTYELFVGDVDESLANQAQCYNRQAYLLTKDNYTEAKGTVFTSVADMQDLVLFRDVCLSAEKIHYYPPLVWSDQKRDGSSEQKTWTERLLRFANQTKTVVNLPKVDQYFDNQSVLPPHRKTDSTQLWVAGCSVTAGVGVEHKQTWKELVSAELQLPYTDLSASGSSIVWSADQICQSNINENDLVFWELTSQHRVPIIDNKQVYHLNPGKFSLYPSVKTAFNIQLIEHDNSLLYYNNVCAVRRVYNFCNKIGAKLVILGVMHDWEGIYTLYDVPVFRQGLCWPNEWIDLGTDGTHPGPEQHKVYVQQFLALYKEFYG